MELIVHVKLKYIKIKSKYAMLLKYSRNNINVLKKEKTFLFNLIYVLF